MFLKTFRKSKIMLFFELLVIFIVVCYVFFVGDSYVINKFNLTSFEVDTVGQLNPVNKLLNFDVGSKINNINTISIPEYHVGPSGLFLLTTALKVFNDDFTVSQYSNFNYRHSFDSMSDNDFFNQQLNIQSCRAAYIAAARLADVPVDFTHKLIYTANGSKSKNDPLGRYDEILEINNVKVNSFYDVVNEIKKSTGNTILVKIRRNAKIYDYNVKFDQIGDDNPFVVDTYDIKGGTKFSITNNNIGGPSGGLMTALYFYSKLTDQPVDNKLICGTGTINVNGNVDQIGDPDLKAITANKYNAYIMFIPNNNKFIYNDNNANVAQKILKQFGSKTKLIKVSTLKQAVDELKMLKVFN